MTNAVEKAPGRAAAIEADYVRKAVAKARLEADKAEAVAQRRAEAIERKERWRAACRELAAKRVTKAIELLQGYLAGGDILALGLAQREVETALRNATQPLPISGGIRIGE
jgi:hypothetical protein